MSNSSLSKEIFEFLDTYAKTAADYDPEFDDPEDRFNGPDSSMFYAAATLIDLGRVPCNVWSEWNSGCYKTNLDSNGFEIHQNLLNRVYALREEK